MRIGVVSLFPEVVAQIAQFGVVGRGMDAGHLSLQAFNPRDHAGNRHRSVDDKPYGGGPGMVMQAEPLAAAIEAAVQQVGGGMVIGLSPQGERFNQAWAQRLSGLESMVLVCGRYEGLDERLLGSKLDLELSLGDFVLSGGEIAAMAVVDACARLLPGVLGDQQSAAEDSFSAGLLDHPHYTRPEVWRGESVPEVLLSGDHRKVARWRLQQALGHTWLKRPELLDDLQLDEDSTALLRDFISVYRP